MTPVDSEHFSMDLGDPAFFTDFPDFDFDFTGATDTLPTSGDDLASIGADHNVQSLPLNLANFPFEPVVDPHSGHNDFRPWISDDFHISADINAFKDNWGLSSTPHECPDTVPPAQTVSNHVPGVDDPLKGAVCSNDGAAHEKKPRSKRTKISNESKKIFLEVFQKDPYPSREDLIELACSTSIPEQVVKTWFANTRAARSSASSRKRKRSIHRSSPTPRKATPGSPLTAESLETLDHASPAPSNVSLEKYIKDPVNEVPTAILEQAARDLSNPKHNPNPDTYTSFNPSRPNSVADSIGSDQSIGSVRSIDSRGSRRGRRTWKAEAQTVERFENNMPDQPDSDVHASKEFMGKNVFQYKCTWPGCYKTFTQRFQWARHEEAIHHCPYHWVCGFENNEPERSKYCYTCQTYGHTAAKHTGTCINKPVEARTFFRSDQMYQHIMRCHPDLKFPLTDIIKSWKIDNPSFSAASLRCGFCGILSDTWEDRQAHVFDHMKGGTCQSSWWSERMPRPSLTELIRFFECPSCKITYENPEDATWSDCSMWSCRYLHTERSLITKPLTVHPGGTETSFYCELCHLSFTDPLVISSHVGVHGLRTCDQEIFVNKDDFIQHLMHDHRVKEARHLRDESLSQFRRIHSFKKMDGYGKLETTILTLLGGCCQDGGFRVTLEEFPLPGTHKKSEGDRNI